MMAVLLFFVDLATVDSVTTVVLLGVVLPVNNDGEGCKKKGR